MLFQFNTDVPAVHNALFGTKLYINKKFPELIAFRARLDKTYLKSYNCYEYSYWLHLY